MLVIAVRAALELGNLRDTGTGLYHLSLVCLQRSHLPQPSSHYGNGPLRLHFSVSVALAWQSLKICKPAFEAQEGVQHMQVDARN